MPHWAGLEEVRWHPLELSAEAAEIAAKLDWYFADPECIVLSARKPTRP